MNHSDTNHADAIGQVWQHVDRELWVLTAQDGSRRGGLVVTTVCSASIAREFPRLTVNLARQHFTWELVEASGAFTAHLLGRDQLPWLAHFGLQTGRETDKLAGYDVERTATGSPRLRDALGWLDCRVEDRLDTGDRTVYLAEIVAGGLTRSEPPLTLHQAISLVDSQVRQALRAHLQRDAQVDAHAIAQWRSNRGFDQPLG